ncbi:hypothetical protein [Phaeodactylibacter luteus]|uniref:Uncharacterized protein n=1 Tax=Phaeodactylibacter luteus TaxID=1564516 RepID=A0A5C6S129_9BACT|nr:hypothetical protein [Phaeodactylibacter luteus]TXB68308.1 hypothetical protein FRY97_02710 [Phaeodactylibacter luteus]
MNWQKSILGLLVFLSFSAPMLNAQEGTLQLLDSPSFEAADGVEPAERVEVRRAAEQLLRKYGQFGTFLDADEEKVTLNASNAFKQLFKATARIFPDYLEFPADYQVDIYEYKNEVSRYMGEEGLKYNLSNAELMSIEKGGRYFNVLVRVQKEMLNYIDDEGGVAARPPGSAVYELELEMEVSMLDYSKAQIRDIRFNRGLGEGPVMPPADWESFTGLVLGGDLAPLPIAPETGWAIGSTSGRTTLETPVSFALGFTWMSNRLVNPTVASRKNLFLFASAYYRYWQLEQRLDNYRLAPFQVILGSGSGEETTYLRQVGPIQGSEKSTLQTVEFPIGLAYRVRATYGSTLFLQAGVVPGLVISSSSRFSGTGTFDGIVEAYNFRFLREGALLLDNDVLEPYRVGEGLTIEAAPELTLRPSLWLMASPALYLDINNQYPVVGLMAALDLRFNLLSYFDPKPAGEPVLRYDDDLPQPLLESANSQVPLHSLGIRVGVYLRLINSPNN